MRVGRNPEVRRFKEYIDDKKNTTRWREVRYRGVGLSVRCSYPSITHITFTISVTTTKLWESNYSEYQQYLFDRIRGYKEHFLTPIGYRKISQILNVEGLKTPRGSVFKNNHVHSIYKKGLIREERMNREDIVEVKDFKVQRIENPTKEFIESVWDKIHVL